MSSVIWTIYDKLSCKCQKEIDQILDSTFVEEYRTMYYSHHTITYGSEPPIQAKTVEKIIKKLHTSGQSNDVKSFI